MWPLVSSDEAQGTERRRREKRERERERGRASEREKDLHGGVSMAKRRWREISSEEDRANNPASCRGSEPENCQSKVPRNKRTFRGAASQTSFLCMCSRGFSPTALVYNYISVTDFIRAQTRRRLRSKPRTCARDLSLLSRLFAIDRRETAETEALRDSSESLRSAISWWLLESYRYPIFPIAWPAERIRADEEETRERTWSCFMHNY